MFQFKRFSLDDRRCGMKLGTDSVALGAWTEISDNARTALDVGAGSGVLALMLAQRAPSLRVTALEYDRGAWLDCSENFAASPWAHRLEVVEGDFAKYTPTEPVDLIISNPPYFDGGPVAPERERATARHEGALGYASLIAYAVRHLSPDGSLAMILPAGRYDDALYQAEMSRLKLRRLCWLLPAEGRAPLRVMMQLRRIDGHCAVESLAVRSSAFAGLTANFYLD